MLGNDQLRWVLIDKFRRVGIEPWVSLKEPWQMRVTLPNKGMVYLHFDDDSVVCKGHRYYGVLSWLEKEVYPHFKKRINTLVMGYLQAELNLFCTIKATVTLSGDVLMVDVFAGVTRPELPEWMVNFIDEWCKRYCYTFVVQGHSAIINIAKWYYDPQES